MDEKHNGGPDDTLRELTRLYRLVSGHTLPMALTRAIPRAHTSALNRALAHLQLVRRGLAAYVDLKGRKGGQGQVEKFRTVLTHKRKELDAQLLEIPQPVEEQNDEERKDPAAPDEPLHWRVLHTYHNGADAPARQPDGCARGSPERC